MKQAFRTNTQIANDLKLLVNQSNAGVTCFDAKFGAIMFYRLGTDMAEIFEVASSSKLMSRKELLEFGDSSIIVGDLSTQFFSNNFRVCSVISGFLSSTLEIFS